LKKRKKQVKRLEALNRKDRWCFYMGQISQPQHRNTAAGENRNIGHFMRVPARFRKF
jgi:hypothetical protein